jgi:hypothetical protein
MDRTATPFAHILCAGSIHQDPSHLGEKDEAFAWLNRAYQERSYLLTYLTVDERLDKLHADPRFDELVRRVGLPAAIRN